MHMSQVIGKYTFEFTFIKHIKFKRIHCYSRTFEIYLNEFKDEPIVICAKTTLEIAIEIKINCFVRVSSLLD